MNWLDLSIIVVLAIAAFFGLKSGLIKIVLSFVGLIIGIVLAGHFYIPLSGRLTFIPNESIAKIAAFILILVGVMIVAAILARLIKLAASMLMLGWVNWLGGAIVGIVMGALFCGALLTAWIKFFGDSTVYIADSLLATVLIKYFPLVLALLPKEFDAVSSVFQ